MSASDSVKAAIVGLEGTRLSQAERAVLKGEAPLGVILFKRNIESPAQVRALVDEVRAALGRDDAPVLIDQEGGRVARLGPPHWRPLPPLAAIGALYAADPAAAQAAAHLHSRLLAHELTGLGIDVDCAPVLDVPVEGAHDVIGDRAFASDPAVVARLGAASLQGFRTGGVIAIVKHIPGHGRAFADSHLALPDVDAAADVLAASDFVPFQACADAPMAMTAHVRYRALDGDQPATTSPQLITEVIRTQIGFNGVLISDDLCMQALCGTPGERAAAALQAGCDLVLHCNGVLDEARDVLGRTPVLSGAAWRRWQAARAWPAQPAMDFDAQEGYARLHEWLGTERIA